MSGRTQDIIIIVWVIVAIIGLLFMLGALRYALVDQAWMRANKLNGLRSVLVHRDVRDEICRCLIQALFVAVGIARLLLPSVPASAHIRLPRDVLIYEIAVNAVFLLIPVILTVQAMLAYRDRNRMLSMDDKAARKRGDRP